ncbi:MAG TPA: hypothetical protein VLI04_11850 [Nocardioidaceae bacterium]|nr:hypothetical protein [Nocardioidaceae bacterium]
MTDDLGVRHPGRREAAVATAVAVLLVMVSWLAGQFGDGNQGPSAGLAASSGADVNELDVPGGEVTEDDIRACLTRPFARSLTEVSVLYSSMQLVEGGEVPVLILRNTSDELRLCDVNGGDHPSVAPIEYADEGTPVRYLSNGRMTWDCDGTKLSGFNVTQWYSVAPVVARAELRFIIDGTTGPWFSARAQGGFVHVHGWLGEQNDGAKVQLESRVLDENGAVVAQSEVPTDPQPVMDCDGRSIQIG